MRMPFYLIALVAIVASAAIAWLGVQETPTQAARISGNESIERLSAMTDRNPGDVGAWKALARAHRNRGQTQQAIAAYVRAARLNPDDTEVILSLRDLTHGK